MTSIYLTFIYLTDQTMWSEKGWLVNFLTSRVVLPLQQEEEEEQEEEEAELHNKIVTDLTDIYPCQTFDILQLWGRTA